MYWIIIGHLFWVLRLNKGREIQLYQQVDFGQVSIKEGKRPIIIIIGSRYYQTSLISIEVLRNYILHEWTYLIVQVEIKLDGGNI